MLFYNSPIKWFSFWCHRWDNLCRWRNEHYCRRLGRL